MNVALNLPLQGALNAKWPVFVQQVEQCHVVISKRYEKKFQLVLIINRKSLTGSRLVPTWHRWPWMTSNGVIALILRYFTEFDSFGGWLRHMGWRWTYNVRKICLLGIFGQNWPTKQSHGLFATVKLLVISVVFVVLLYFPLLMCLRCTVCCFAITNK